MRVIKIGVKKSEPDTEIVTTCRECDTQFGFLPSEAKLVNDNRDGDYYEIFCPVCSIKVTKAKPRYRL